MDFSLIMGDVFLSHDLPSNFFWGGGGTGVNLGTQALYHLSHAPNPFCLLCFG
jgi:hypothetical protein